MSLTYLGGVIVGTTGYAQYIDTETDAVHFIHEADKPVIENTFIKFNSSCEAFDKDGKTIGRFWGYPDFKFKLEDGTEISDLYTGDYIRSERMVVQKLLEMQDVE